MGRTQRKTSKYLQLYRKKIKKKVDTILPFTPPNTSKDDFFRLFEEIYPDEVLSMRNHYQFYQEKNKRRRVGKPLYFPTPSELIYDIASHKIKIKEVSVWNVTDSEISKKKVLRESKIDQENRKKRYRENNISTQEVTPNYIITLIGRYWKETRKEFRLYIVQECSKYKNRKTVIFFRKVLHGEKDWFIKNVAFRILQRFDEVVYLPPKGKGKRERYNTLVEKFGCDYKEDIGKGPLDIMKEFYDNNYIQTSKDFDVFISHSVSNSSIVDNIVEKLNSIGLVAFVDWKSDKEDLKRSKTNQYTADVLQMRMNQSKCLFLIRTKESDSSIWVAWEIGYFSALGRKISVFDVGADMNQKLEFICGFPKAFIKDENLSVSENDFTYDFISWLSRENT